MFGAQTDTPDTVIGGSFYQDSLSGEEDFPVPAVLLELLAEADVDKISGMGIPGNLVEGLDNLPEVFNDFRVGLIEYKV